MAWTSPSTRATGNLITASIWNTDLVDDLAYLKTQTDLLNTVTQSSPSRAKDTVYQNTSGKPRMVAVIGTQSCPAGGTLAGGSFAIGTTTAPDVAIADYFFYAAATVTVYDSVVSVVPPTYYYKYYGLTNIKAWTEWDFH